MRMIKEIAFAASLTLAAIYSITTGKAHESKIGNITIVHPWSRQSPSSAGVAAGFMKITNAGTEDDRLVKATATISGTAQLHQMKMEGEVMKMVEIPEGIIIPAGQTVELKPGSLHVMFLDLSSRPKEGEMFGGTLVFEKAGTAEVEYVVKAPNAGMSQ